MKLQGMTAIVTGASTGIGREIAKAIAANGGRLGLVGRNAKGLEETRQAINHLGQEAKVFLVDLRIADAIEKLAADVSQVWGSIDALVNCAGIWHNGGRSYYGRSLVDTPIEEIDEVFEVGIRAPFLLARAFLPGMIQEKKGKILNISGTFASGGAHWLHYYVSKKALESFTVGLADELRPHEIQVNCISPSDVQTDALAKFFPDDYKNAIHPSEVANLAVFLLSPEADHIDLCISNGKLACPW